MRLSICVWTAVLVILNGCGGRPFPLLADTWMFK
jgi:hypothetical protein